MFYWPKSVSKLFLMTASLMALYLYISFPHYQTGVQLPYCLQTVGQLPIFCLLHYSELDMAGLTIEGKSFLEAPQKCLLGKKKKKKVLADEPEGFHIQSPILQLDNYAFLAPRHSPVLS